MSRTKVDAERLRVAPRRMDRGDLLVVAERADEIVPNAKLGALVRGLVKLEDLGQGRHGAAPLLE